MGLSAFLSATILCWFNVTFVRELFLRTLHSMGNHRRPLVMRDLSERLVSGRKEPRAGGGGGGGGGGGVSLGLKPIWPRRSPLGRGGMPSYQLGIWIESNICSLFSS